MLIFPNASLTVLTVLLFACANEKIDAETSGWSVTLEEGGSSEGFGDGKLPVGCIAQDLNIGISTRLYYTAVTYSERWQNSSVQKDLWIIKTRPQKKCRYNE